MGEEVPEWIKEKGCKSKRPFNTKKGAKLGAKRWRKIKGTRLRPYDCPHCDKWHLTSQKPSKRTEQLINQFLTVPEV